MEVSEPEGYIAAAPEPLRPLLRRVRACLADALPDAEEMVVYGMPGFGSGKTVIAGYGAFSRQCGLYVHAAAIAAHADDIASAGLKATKTGVTFGPGKPIPDELVTKLAITSRQAHGL